MIRPLRRAHRWIFPLLAAALIALLLAALEARPEDPLAVAPAPREAAP